MLARVLLLSAAAIVPLGAADPHVFVQLTDVHLGKPAPYENEERMQAHLENFRRAIQEVNQAIRPEFVLITGDCVSTTDEDSIKLFAREIKALSMPVHVIPGNHDEGSVKAGWFEEHIGSGRLVIRGAGWHIVAFDGRPLKTGDHETSSKLLGWIGEQFKEPPADTEVRALASHYPMHFDASWSNPAATRPFFQLTGAPAIRLNLLAAETGVTAYIAGHTHAAYATQDPHSNVTSVNSAATQNGAYRIYSSDHGIFSSAAAEVGKWPKIIVTQPKTRYEGGREFVSGRMVVRAAVYSPADVQGVECRFGDRFAHPMRAAGRGIWQTEVDTTTVGNGKYAIVVTARTGEGSGEAVATVAVGNPPR